MTSRSGPHRVIGIEFPVSIKIDRWGVPHIEADTLGDLFFAQGFNAARDRLWQIDLWRKRGLGLLAADFGPGYLEQDRAARLFLYRGDMEAEWASYGPDTRSICEAFANGVNAYIAEIEAGRTALPAEFTRLATSPSRWKAEDVVRIRSHGLSRNAHSEILRAFLLETDSFADDLRTKLTPAVEPAPFANDILRHVPADASRLLLLASAPVTFSPSRLSCDLSDAGRWHSAAAVAEAESVEGSNNWAVAGRHTSHGRPILANDPHRILSLPSLRYLIHLKAPGLNVIGAGDPHAPGICIGHNEVAAFGLTIFKADQEDVFVFRTDPGRPNIYYSQEGWVEFATVEEAIPVKGYPHQTVRMRFTHHGPVIFEDAERQRCFALRSVWFDPGSAPYLGSLAYLRARNIAEFTDALDRWSAPSVNQVYADVAGVIARIPCGLIPIRTGFNGLTPVPGQSQLGWCGWRPLHRLAAVVDPDCGYVYSANQMNLRRDWDHISAPVGFEWDDSSRAFRIDEALSTERSQDVPASCNLQTDVVSRTARRVLAVLRNLTIENVDARAALSELTAWDGAMTGASGPAALFQLWWRGRFKPKIIDRLVVPESRTHVGAGHDEAFLDLLERPNSRLSSAELAALVSESLNNAWQDATKVLGRDASTWRWDRIHHALFSHPLTPLSIGSDKGAWDIGPFPLGGDGSTVMHFDCETKTRRITTGASVRIVMDVGEWDRSVWINSPGQSGDPLSPHYDDLAPIWACGEYVPMLFSESSIAEHIEEAIELIPERPVR